MEKSEQIRTQEAKKTLLAALEKTMGIVSPACKKAKVGRTAHYQWMENDPEYKKAVEELNNLALDFAESKLLISIRNGSDTATIFYLKTKGKKRGYVERNEVTGADGAPIQTSSVDNLTFEELYQLKYGSKPESV